MDSEYSIILKLIIFSFVLTTLYIYLLNYILKLEKIGCECSAGWRRDFIKYYLILFFFILLITIAFWRNKFINTFSYIIFPIINIFFVYVVFEYVQKLKQEKCACSAGIERNVLEIFNYIQIILLTISFIKIVFASTLFSSKSIKK